MKEGFRHKEEQSKDREGADFFEDPPSVAQCSVEALRLREKQ